MNIYVDSPPPGKKVAPPKGLKEPKKGLQERTKGLKEPKNVMNKEEFLKWYIENYKRTDDTDADIQMYAEDAWDLEDPNWKLKINRETNREFKNRQLYHPNWNNENNDELHKFMADVTGGPKKKTNGGYKRTRRTKRNKRNTQKRFKRK